MCLKQRMHSHTQTFTRHNNCSTIVSVFEENREELTQLTHRKRTENFHYAKRTENHYVTCVLALGRKLVRNYSECTQVFSCLHCRT